MKAPMADARKKQTSYKRTFLTGLVVLTPVLVTIWVVKFVLAQISGTVNPLVLRGIRLIGSGAWLETAWVNFVSPIISVLLAVLMIYFLGTLAGNVLGRQLIQWLEKLLMTIPVVRGIYSATRQFLETFSGDKTKAFNKVVLFEYPRQGLWTMGLLTGKTRGEVRERSGQDMVSVFVPTTPNPTSGWLIFVPIGDIQELDMSVDEAFKMIISGGVLTPPSKSSQKAEVPNNPAKAIT